MADRHAPRYGTPNWDLVAEWSKRPAEKDHPFWAINLMRYRALADYADGRETRLTGREADDLYAPLGPLAAIGAVPVFLADLTAQIAGEPQFHRIGIVRYPSRAKFFEMQSREDFQQLHAHKEAGMEFTIVFASTPVGPLGAAADGVHLLRVRRYREGQPVGADPVGVVPLLRFEVEAVIVGDERRWNDACFDYVAPDSLAALADVKGVEEQLIFVLGEAEIDELAKSVEGAAAAD